MQVVQVGRVRASSSDAKLWRGHDSVSLANCSASGVSCAGRRCGQKKGHGGAACRQRRKAGVNELSRAFRGDANLRAMRRHIPVLLAALLAASCTPLPPAVPPGPAPIPQDEPITPAEAQPSPGLTRVRIISLNDFHGALRPVEDASGVRRGGAAFVATAIRNAAEGCAEPCAVLVLDGGDTFQGTLPSNLTYGRAVLDVYRA